VKGYDMGLAFFENVTCAACGIEWGMSGMRVTTLRNSHADFYCPNGHILSFKGKTETDILKEKVGQLEAQLKARTAERDDLSSQYTKEIKRSSAYKGQITTLKKRLTAWYKSAK